MPKRKGSKTYLTTNFGWFRVTNEVPSGCLWAIVVVIFVICAMAGGCSPSK